MSAYIVPTQQIDEIVAEYYVSSSKSDEEKTKILSEIGQILLNENYISVNCRYREKAKAPTYYFRNPVKKQRPIQLLKFCSNLRYQSCETETYEESKAYKILNEIVYGLITRLEGFDEAKWGL